MPGIFYNSDGEIVRLGPRVGVGGEGEVCEVRGREDLVAKIYYEAPPSEKARKLLALTRLGTERLLGLSAWPIDLLYDQPQGRIAGFVMKRIGEAEEVHALHSPKSRLQKFPEASWAFLIHVAANFARAVAAIHEHGLVIGDVNPRNTLVTKRATVYLLDCDSFQVSIDGETYRCENGFPEYTPPELQAVPFREVDRGPEHDSFGLAVVIFQLLFLGRHPFSGQYLGAGEMPLEQAIGELRFAYGPDAESRQMRRPPGTLALEAVSRPVAELFCRAFLSASAAERPGPLDWIAPLDELAESLRRCDLHSGHQYYGELSACPWCGIEMNAGVRLFKFSFDRTSWTPGHFRLDRIWKEIKAIEPPQQAPPKSRDKAIDRLVPSEEVAVFALKRRITFIGLMIASGAIGFAIAWAPHYVVSSILIAVMVLAFVRWLTEKSLDETVWGRNLLSALSMLPDESLIRKIEQSRREAEIGVAQVEQQWKRRANDERFFSHLEELRSHKRAYQGLTRARKAKPEQPGPVSVRAGIEVKMDIDGMRQRLETELAEGPFYLNRIKREIEESRRSIFPELVRARRSLAQAEKDAKVAIKRDWLTLLVVVLSVAITAGSIVRYKGRSEDVGRRAVSMPWPPGNNGVDGRSPDQDIAEWLRWYRDGEAMVEAGHFESAVESFQKAVTLNLNNWAAHEGLGYALYHLGHYYESIQASKTALAKHKSFGLYYNLGLAHIALGNWQEARAAFKSANDHRRVGTWRTDYSDACYNLALSLTRLGEARGRIRELERRLKSRPEHTLLRFELANLYLCADRPGLVRAQHQRIKGQDEILARELQRLMKRHGKSQER